MAGVPCINVVGSGHMSDALHGLSCGQGNKALVELGRALTRGPGTPAPGPSAKAAKGLAFHVPMAPSAIPGPAYINFTKTGVSDQPRDGKNTQGR